MSKTALFGHISGIALTYNCRKGQFYYFVCRDVREIVKQVEEAPDDFPSIHITSSDLHFIHFPIIDCDIAEDSSVYGLAVDLVERLSHKEVIYLHCWGGHGRTGSVVCIMLHLMYGLNAKDAMERCQVCVLVFCICSL